jgi:hypothetical protein
MLLRNDALPPSGCAPPYVHTFACRLHQITGRPYGRCRPSGDGGDDPPWDCVAMLQG